MTAYGITSTGFVPKTVQQLVLDLNAQHLANVDPALDLAPDQPIGQLIAIEAEKLAELWELAATCYNGMDPDQAEGPQLVSLSSLTGQLPTQAAPSLVTCNMTLGAAATVPAGSVANVTGQPSNTWVLLGPPNSAGQAVPGPVVSTTAGVYPGVFASTSNGPNTAPATTLSVITAPVTGWTAVSNPQDAALGTYGYQGSPSDDTTLRQQREASLAAAGASTLDALTAALDTLPGMISATLYENTSSVPFAGYPAIPANSFMAVVWDGLVPAVANNTIAQAIWNSRPAGIQPYGTSAGTAIDSQGNPHTVPFQRVSTLPLYVSATVSSITALTTSQIAALKAQLVAYCQSLLSPGTEAVALALRSSLLSSAAAGNVPGVYDVPTFYLGFNPAPSASANLFAGYAQVILANTANILINGL